MHFGLIGQLNYKNPMGMSPYKMVYGNACHLPLELEHKAYWAIKELNYDFLLVKRGYLILAHLMNGESKLMKMLSYLNKKIKDGMVRESKSLSLKSKNMFFCTTLVQILCRKTSL